MIHKNNFLSITHLALVKLREELDSYKNTNGIDGNLRISVRSRGCKGISHDIEMVDFVNEGDEVLEFEGTKIHIALDAVMWLIGSRLDYVKSECEEKFVFSNPKDVKLCHCKEAFYR